MKLRSGEEIIAKIVGQEKASMVVERPFAFRLSTMMDPLGRHREITTLRNWVKHTNQIRIKVPKDHIAMFLEPDEDTSRLYELEMEREDVDIKPTKIAPLDQMFDNMLGNKDPESPSLENLIDKMIDTEEQGHIDNKIKNMLDSLQDKLEDSQELNNLPEGPPDSEEKDFVVMNMMFPASLLDDLIERGIINKNDLMNMKNMMDEEIDDDFILDNGEGLSDVYTPDGDGTNWSDWSPNLLDYFKDDIKDDNEDEEAKEE